MTAVLVTHSLALYWLDLRYLLGSVLHTSSPWENGGRKKLKLMKRCFFLLHLLECRQSNDNDLTPNNFITLVSLYNFWALTSCEFCCQHLGITCSPLECKLCENRGFVVFHRGRRSASSSVTHSKRAVNGTEWKHSREFENESSWIISLRAKLSIKA